jgi:hypothetical protein
VSKQRNGRGRIPQATVDEVKRRLRQDEAPVNIAVAVGISVASVYQIKRYLMPAKNGGKKK